MIVSYILFSFFFFSGIPWLTIILICTWT